MGRTSCNIKRYVLIIKYWFKILLSEDVKYIKLVYNMMLDDLEMNPNKTNWASLLRHLLFSMGLNEACIQQGVGNVNNFISLFKQRLTDNFIQNWQSDLQNPQEQFSTDHLLHFSFSHILIRSMFLNIYKHTVNYACHHTG